MFTRLDEILMKLGCKKPFCKNGEFTKRGYKAYSKLIEILYDVKKLTGRYKIYDIVEELDKISNE